LHQSRAELAKGEQPMTDDEFASRMLFVYRHEMSIGGDRVTHAAAARLLNMHAQSLHRLIEDNRITRDKFRVAGSPYSFRLTEIRRFLDETQADIAAAPKR
jgi:hypothetical protein